MVSETPNAIPVLQAGGLLGGVHTSTIKRWYAAGVNGVVLSTFWIGGRRFTTPDACREFIDATTARGNSKPPYTGKPRGRPRTVAAKRDAIKQKHGI